MRPTRSIAARAKAGVAAVLVVAGLAGAPGVAAVAAVPAATTAAMHASAASAVRPSHAPAVDITCPFHGNRFTTYYGSCLVWADYSCNLGDQHIIGPPDFVSNACGYDVILYSNENETGSQLCVAPFTKTHHLGSPWRSFRVVAGFNC